MGNISHFKLSCLSELEEKDFFEKIIEDSDEILQGKIKFDNEWDMEQCKQSFALINNCASISPNGDGEWVYQYSRMEFLRKLVISYAKTQNPKYLDKYLSILLDFYQKNNCHKNALKRAPRTFFGKAFNKLKYLYIKKIKKECEKFSTYRTLDTAIRSYSVLVDMQYIGNSIVEKDKDFIFKRIKQDVDFAKSNLRDFDETSNWGIIILSLAATSYLMLEEFDDLRGIEQHLIRMLDVQIKKDGGHIENSCMYHTQILLCLLRYIYWAKLKNHTVDTNVIKKCNLMAQYCFWLSDSSGYQIQYGDSDKTSLNTVFYIAKKVLENKTLNQKGKVADFILLSEFPHYLCEIEKATNESAHIHQNFVVDDGIWIFENELWSLRLFNETSSSAHKHADNCSVVLYYKNKPILIDGGRYSYFNPEKRAFYRGPLAHNIATVDGGKEWTPKNKNAFVEIPQIIKNELDGTLFKGQYRFDNQRTTLKRTVYLDTDVVLLVSKVECQGKHVLETVWNFPCNVPVLDCGGYISVDEELCFSHTGDYFNIDSSSVSYHYNEESASKRLIVTSEFIDFGTQIAVFACKPTKISFKDEKTIIIEDENGNTLNSFSI